jgi:multiple sugar transport system substrate-binding protein
VLVAAVGCGASPGGVGPPDGAGNGPVTIVWWSGPATWGTDNDAPQVLRDAFERANPSIRVHIETGPDSTDRQRAALISDLSAKSANPDVYSGDVVWPYEFAHDGLAVRLDRYLPASFWSTFAAPGTPLSRNTVVQNVTYNGGIYAVPYYIDKGLLYFRKDLLAKAGLKVPTTWEQLIQDSDSPKADGLAYRYVWQGNDYEGLTCDWMEVFADALGGAPVGGNIAAELASPAAVKALNLLRTLITGGVSPSDSNTLEESDGDSLFDSGKAAFLREWDSSYANAMSATSAIADPDDVGVAPLPDFADQQGPGWSALGGWNLFVNPHSAQLKADLTFITWMAGPQAQRILATTPTRTQIAATLSAVGGAVTGVAFSGDGATLASSADDHTIRLWSLGSGRTVSATATLEGPVNATGVVFEPGGQTVAAAAADGTALFWNTNAKSLADQICESKPSNTQQMLAPYLAGIAYHPVCP